MKRFVERALKIKVGNGLDESIEMGPAINEEQLNRDLSYIDIGKAEGARLLAGGKRMEGGDLQHGYFVQPTVFGDVAPKMRIAQEEIFGPVVSLIPCDSFEHDAAVTNEPMRGLAWRQRSPSQDTTR